jgi:hypothetical protein
MGVRTLAWMLVGVLVAAALNAAFIGVGLLVQRAGGS